MSLAEAGFRRIVLLNGHYVNTWAMQYAAGDFAHELPSRYARLPVRVLARPAAGARRPLPRPGGRIHANVGETSAMLAIDPALVDMERARDFDPDFGELRTSPYTVLDAVMFPRPGAFHAATLAGGGVWGARPSRPPSSASEFLDWCRQAVVDVVHDMDAVHDRLDAGG